MNRVVAATLVFCLGVGLAVAEPVAPGSQVRPTVISASDIEAAAKAEAVQDEGTGSPMPAASSAGTTWIIVLLAVLVVGGALYLIGKNESESGSDFLSDRGGRKLGRPQPAPVQYRHPLLRQQFQAP